MSDYEPFDQTAWLGRAPWDDTPALNAWETAHGHDVRVKCYVEFGCQVIEPALERRIENLQARIERVETLVEKWREARTIGGAPGRSPLIDMMFAADELEAALAPSGSTEEVPLATKHDLTCAYDDCVAPPGSEDHMLAPSGSTEEPR